MKMNEIKNFEETDNIIKMFLLTIGAFALLLLVYSENRSLIVKSLTDPIYLTMNIRIWAIAILAIIGFGYYMNWIVEGSLVSLSFYWLSLLCLPGVIFFSPIIGIYALFKHRKIIIEGGKCLIRNSLKAQQ